MSEQTTCPGIDVDALGIMNEPVVCGGQKARKYIHTSV